MLVLSLLGYSCFFFFSSRRRHTSCALGRSSDVCSSDLLLSALRSRLPASEGKLARSIADVLDAAEPDRDFAAAMAEAGTVILPFAFLPEPIPSGGTGPSPDIRRAAFRVFSRPAGPELRPRSEEHTSELQSLMRISYAVFS